MMTVQRMYGLTRTAAVTLLKLHDACLLRHFYKFYTDRLTATSINMTVTSTADCCSCNGVSI